MIAKTLPGEVAPDYKAVDPFEDYAAKLDFNFAGRQRETPRRHLDDRAREDLRDRAADIVRSFRGEPNRAASNRSELRWGRNGSFSLNGITHCAFAKSKCFHLALVTVPGRTKVKARSCRPYRVRSVLLLPA